jgi:hypothetical protein
MYELIPLHPYVFCQKISKELNKVAKAEFKNKMKISSDPFKQI